MMSRARKKTRLSGLFRWTWLALILITSSASAAHHAPGPEVQKVLDAYVDAWESRNPFRLLDLAPIGSQVFTPLLSNERFDQTRQIHVVLKDVEVKEQNGGKRVTVIFTKLQEDLFWVGTLSRGRTRIKMSLRRGDGGYRVVEHTVLPRDDAEASGEIYVSSNPTTWTHWPFPAERNFYLAYQKIMLGKTQESRDILRKLVDRTPEDSGLDQIQYTLGTDVFRAQIHYFLGLAEKRLGNSGEWTKQMRQAVKLNPSFALALNELALHDVEQGRIDEGLRRWRFSLDLASKQDEVHAWVDFYEGALRYPKGELRDLFLRTRGLPPSQALEILGQLLMLDANHVETRRRLASMHLLNYDPISAEKHLKKNQFLRPGDIETEYLLGRVYLAMSRFEDALKQFQLVWNEQPNYRDTLVYLSELNSIKRRYRQALSYLRESLLLRPSDPVILYKLGVYSMKLGDRFEAMAYLRQAIDAKPPEHIRQDLYTHLVNM